jgi:hypothetical protein
VTRHLQLVFTNAARGRDDEFNAWYDGHHVPELSAKIPGFVSGRRYRLNPSQRSGQPAARQSRWRYLAVYELDSDDLAATHAAIAAVREAGGFTPNGGTRAEDRAAWSFTEAGPLVSEDDVPLAGKGALGSARHLFLAFTNPAAGHERAFDAWYELHVSEVVAHFPGLVTGQLYDRSPEQRPGMSPPWRRLARYDLETDDVEEYHRRDQLVRDSGVLTPHEGALDPEYAVWVYSELGAPVVTAPASASAGA